MEEPIAEAAPPQAAAKGKPSPWRSAGSVLALVAVFFVKFKAVFFSSFSFLASIGVYTLFWGWKFAVVFTLLIFVHEMGHAVFMRAYGVPASLPYFIPGMGALIAIKGKPASVLHESYIALGGPLVGSLGAALCLGYGLFTESVFWIAAAYTGFFLNLFNLFPVVPLDGGRVVGSISPRIWIFGFAAMAIAIFALHLWNPLMIVLVLLGLPRALQAWKAPDPGDTYYKLTAAQRAGVAIAYFGLCALLLAAMVYSHVPSSRLG
jgi:Zn-dependent protease